MTTAVVTTTMTLTLTLRPVSSIPVTSGFVPIASQSDYVARKRSALYRLDSQGRYNNPRAKRCIPLRPDIVSCDQTVFTTTTRTVANQGACPTPLPVTTVTRQPRVATVDTTVTSTVWSISTETATVNATVFDTVTELTTSTFTWTSRVISNGTVIQSSILRTTLLTWPSLRNYNRCHHNRPRRLRAKQSYQDRQRRSWDFPTQLRRIQEPDPSRHPSAQPL